MSRPQNKLQRDEVGFTEEILRGHRIQARDRGGIASRVAALPLRPSCLRSLRAGSHLNQDRWVNHDRQDAHRQCPKASDADEQNSQQHQHRGDRATHEQHRYDQRFVPCGTESGRALWISRSSRRIRFVQAILDLNLWSQAPSALGRQSRLSPRLEGPYQSRPPLAPCGWKPRCGARPCRPTSGRRRMDLAVPP